MKGKVRISTIIGVLIMLLFTAVLIVLGYRVIVTSGELPGKLGSVSVAAENCRYIMPTLQRVQKVEYDTMKYGYMDDMLLAQMDLLDKNYEFMRMEEIRAVNNLTAMEERTADKLAYEQAKAEQEEIARKARQAAELAELARQAKLRADAEARKRELYGLPPLDDGTSVGGDSDSASTASRGGKKGDPVFAESKGESLGKFVVTAYCTCRVCCGVYSGGNRTASGTVPTSNRTIAVDTSVIPFGTKVVINGQIYVAEDRGSAIKGKRIDMFFMTHKEATRWGRKTIEVFLAK